MLKDLGIAFSTSFFKNKIELETDMKRKDTISKKDVIRTEFIFELITNQPT